MQRMLRLAERLAVMAKAEYRKMVNSQRTAQQRFLLVAQKNGTDAETCADDCAEHRAEVCAE
jgi:hypothetical protein